MAAHLEKAAIVEPLLANEDRLDRRLHVVVDPARAGAFEEGKRPVMGVEHHLLALARIGAHEQHPGMAGGHGGRGGSNDSGSGSADAGQNQPHKH